jgi:hypothetical protein
VQIGKWFGNKHFSTTNSYLKANGKTEIDWIFNNESLFNNASFLKRRNIRFFPFERDQFKSETRGLPKYSISSLIEENLNDFDSKKVLTVYNLKKSVI